MSYLLNLDDELLRGLKVEAAEFWNQIEDEIERRAALARRVRAAKRGRVLAMLGDGWKLPRRLARAPAMEIGG